MTAEQLKEARKAYLISLSEDEEKLIRELTGATTWGELITALENVGRLVTELEKVAFDPPRTELVARLKTYLHKIEVTVTPEAVDWFYASMSATGQDALEEFGGKLGSVQRFSEVLTQRTLKILRKASTSEIGQLKNLEKNMENLFAWVDKLTQTILQGFELQKVLTSVEDSVKAEYKATPAKEIVSSFLGVAESLAERVESQATNFDKAQESCKQAKETIERDWIVLKPALNTISQQYQALISSAKPLVPKEVSEWTIKVPNNVVSELDKLTGLVRQIIELQDSISNVEEQVSSMAQVTGEIPSEFARLRDVIASLGQAVTAAKLSSTLRECSESLKKLGEGYKNWLQEGNQIQGQWLRKANSWLSISKREGVKMTSKLAREIQKSEVLSIHKDSFGKVASSCIEVEKLANDLRKELRGKLTGDQVRLLDIVTSLEAKSDTVNINDIQKDFGKFTAQQLADLVELSEKQLLSVKISTGEEHHGS